ncbi:MAG: hypothetical protein B6U72_01510 [Candidatus Altiarchaeales archaeon ex4484_2]|nr:MAG: hypothetical protein B6U72_01510 [Candidatus Altiarchaeales archaeon ex4484_2]
MIKMPSLTEKIKKVVGTDSGIMAVTIANDEGLRVVSTTDDDEAAASGVYEIKQKLSDSKDNFVTIFDREGLKYLYSDGQFHYVIRSKNPLDQKTIDDLRYLLDEDTKERKNRRQERQKEIEEKKRDRERRQREIEEKKKKREEIAEEIKKKKKDRKQIAEEIKKKKKNRKEIETEIKIKKKKRKKR